MRVPTPGGPRPHADLLLSGTGRGTLTRYLLRPSLRARGPFVGSLLPHRAPSGPVHLAARQTGELTWDLLWAGPRSGWTAFATLEVGDEPGRDLDLSFDAVGAAPPGLEVYDWHRRVRGPSYAVARRARGAVSPHELDGSQSSTTTASLRRTARLTRSRSLRP